MGAIRLLLLTFVLAALPFSFLHGAPFKGARYVNGYGESIVLSTHGATIDGHFYAAKSCSNRDFYCVKYSKYFAILVPVECGHFDHSSWVGDGVGLKIIAMVPHDDKKMLLGTTYGKGLVAYEYDYSHGITGVIYERGAFLGNKVEWYKRVGVDLKKDYYKIVYGESFLVCR